MSNIKLVKGNIFNTKAQTVVNTVNCVGVMGKGIALVYKLRYPQMFDVYHEYCKQHLIGIGKLWLYKGDANDPWVLNFPTKFHWKYPSKIEYIEQGLKKFVETYEERGITSIAFPMLGTFNGGLDKDIVYTIMLKYLSQCNIPVEIYEYDPMASDDLFETFKEKWISIPYNELKGVTHIRQKRQIDTIDNALRHDDLKSMISLISYPGIGIKTMECCFKVIMNYQKKKELSLFSQV
jgi:O-acetyl-ADP-ribose deacetylase (regulator of RNase III)